MLCLAGWGGLHYQAGNDRPMGLLTWVNDTVGQVPKSWVGVVDSLGGDRWFKLGDTDTHQMICSELYCDHDAYDPLVFSYDH